jgi:hypothetical protein
VSTTSPLKHPIADIDLRRFVPLAEVVTTFCLRKKDGLCRGVREPVSEVASPFDHLRVQLACGANTNNIGVMFISSCLKSGEAAMKPTDEDDEKIASLKRKTLPTFVLAALVFMLTVAGTSALWWFVIAAMRR